MLRPLALDNKPMKPLLQRFPSYTHLGDASSGGPAMTPGDQLIEFVLIAFRN